LVVIQFKSSTGRRVINFLSTVYHEFCRYVINSLDMGNIFSNLSGRFLPHHPLPDGPPELVVTGLPGQIELGPAVGVLLVQLDRVSLGVPDPHPRLHCIG